MRKFMKKIVTQNNIDPSLWLYLMNWKEMYSKTVKQMILEICSMVLIFKQRDDWKELLCIKIQVQLNKKEKCMPFNIYSANKWCSELKRIISFRSGEPTVLLDSMVCRLKLPLVLSVTLDAKQHTTIVLCLIIHREYKLNRKESLFIHMQMRNSEFRWIFTIEFIFHIHLFLLWFNCLCFFKVKDME